MIGTSGTPSRWSVSIVRKPVRSQPLPQEMTTPPGFAQATEATARAAMAGQRAKASAK